MLEYVDDHHPDYMIQRVIPAAAPGMASNSSSLARDMRYSSRSMGNNLDNIPNNGSVSSRSIAALDVLPRNEPTVIFNNQPQQSNNRRPILTKVVPEPPSLCHSLRTRFTNGSTTTSSASGSRPPSPIIEIVPVSEYENMYGSLHQQQSHHLNQQPQPSPIYAPQYSSAATGT